MPNNRLVNASANDEAKYNYITIGNADYRVKKFTPKIGMRISPILISKLIPAISAMGKSRGEDDATDVMFDQIGEAIARLAPSDMDTLHDACLTHAEKKLPAKYVECYNTNGNGYYPVPEIEWDFPLALRLMVECIKWNFASFFDGSNSAFSGFKLEIGKLLNA